MAVLVLLLAVATDGWQGESPVVWKGKALQWRREWLAPLVPVAQDWTYFLFAAFVWSALIALVFIFLEALRHG